MKRNASATKAADLVSRRSLLSAAVAAGLASALKAGGDKPSTRPEAKTGANWFAETFRKIHWDFDQPPLVPDVGAKFDARQFIARLKQARVSAAQFFARDCYGHAYYNTAFGEKHPKLKRDLLGEIAWACRSEGIRVLFYYQCHLDNWAWRNHPDWRKIEKSGKPMTDGNFGLVCFNSPRTEQLVLPQLRELAREYPVDGFFLDSVRPSWCFCRHCQAQFQQEFGEALPKGERDPLFPDVESAPRKPGEFEDPVWGRYVQWRRRKCAEFIRKCADAVHAIRPEVLVGVNAYAHTLRHPQGKPVDHLGYLITESWEPLRVSLESRFLAPLGKPFAVMNTRFPYAWGDWALKPAEQLMQEFAPILGNGGTCWVGCKMYPDGTLENEAYECIGEAYRFVQQREEFCRDARSVPYVALLRSDAAPRLYKNADRDLLPIQGAHKALAESGYHFHVLNEEMLLGRIGQYKTLVLADQSYLSEPMVGAIEKFVRQGGGLLATYSSSARDESGQLCPFALSRVFGVELEKEYPYSVPLLLERSAGGNYAYIKVSDPRVSARIKDLPLLVHGRFLYVKPTTALPLCDLVHHLNLEEAPGRFAFGDAPPGQPSGCPAVTLNQYGAGRVAYVSGELFTAYWRKNQVHLKYLVKSLMDLVTQDKVLVVDAPPSVEVSLMRQRERLIVHLWNYHVERPSGGRTMAEYVPPVRNIRVRVKLENEPAKLTQMPEGVSLRPRFGDGCVSFTVPEMRIHSCVIIEPVKPCLKREKA